MRAGGNRGDNRGDSAVHDDIKPPISGGQEQTTDTETETERRRPSHKKPCGRCVITAVDSPWLAARADTRCFTFLPASEPRVKQTPDCAQVLFSAYSAEKARYASRKAVLASQRQAGMLACRPAGRSGASWLCNAGLGLSGNQRTNAFSIGSISNLGGQQLLPSTRRQRESRQ